jgi:hypothetical protein
MPPELMSYIEAAAGSFGRSMNAKIVVRLEQSLKLEAESNLKAIETDLADIKATLAARMSAKLSKDDLQKVVAFLRSATTGGSPKTLLVPFLGRDGEDEEEPSAAAGVGAKR